jgi:hypothetical protein
MKTLFLLLAVISPILLSSPAISQTDEDRALEAFDEGAAQYEAKQYLNAAKSFRIANKLNPSWKILYNIGQAEAAAKRPGLALQAFEAYLTEGGDEVPVDKQEEVLGEIERLRKIVGYLDVRAPDGYLVVIDDEERELTPLPGPMPVAAGTTHSFRLTVDGTTVMERSVRVSGGQTIQVAVDDVEVEKDPGPGPSSSTKPKAEQPAEQPAPSPPVAPEPAKAPPVPPPMSPLKIAGIGAMGAGGALLVAGLITGISTTKLDGELEDNCPDKDCPAAYWGDADRVERLSLATNILLGVGAGVAAAGAVLFILGHRHQKRESAASSILPGPGQIQIFVWF